MSSSLVKKSLELFEDDLLERDARGKVKKPSSSKKRVDKSKLGVHKHLREANKYLSRKQGKKRSSKLEKYRPDSSEDHTEKNIMLLQRLSDAAKTEESYTAAVFGHKKDDKSTEPEEESTLFTDADFEKFEKEYNFK